MQWPLVSHTFGDAQSLTLAHDSLQRPPSQT
jgi:hypothetical protein